MAAIVLDKKYIAIADFEFRTVRHFHGLITHCAAQHSHGVGAAGVALHRIFDFKDHVTYDGALRAFTDPLRAHIGDDALENDLGPVNQFIERGWNDGGSVESARAHQGGEEKEGVGKLLHKGVRLTHQNSDKRSHDRFILQGSRS